MTVIVDGGRGEVILEPDFELQGRFADRAARDLVQTERLARAREAPAISLDGSACTSPPTSSCWRRFHLGRAWGRRNRAVSHRIPLSGTKHPATEEEQYQHALAPCEP